MVCAFDGGGHQPPGELLPRSRRGLLRECENTQRSCKEQAYQSFERCAHFD
jgi:hypothetical protein